MENWFHTLSPGEFQEIRVEETVTSGGLPPVLNLNLITLQKSEGNIAGAGDSEIASSLFQETEHASIISSKFPRCKSKAPLEVTPEEAISWPTINYYSRQAHQ